MINQTTEADMEYEMIDDHTQMKPGDMLEYRCPRFGLLIAMARSVDCHT